MRKSVLLQAEMMETFLLCFDTANFVLPREFTVKPSLYY